MIDLDEANFDSLSARLRDLHNRILDLDPRIDRVACVLYDEEQDVSQTFLNSTRDGATLQANQYRPDDSRSFSYMARTSEARQLFKLPNVLHATTEHSESVLSEGFLSSFTVPMYEGDHSYGFIFFDSRVEDTFGVDLQRELALFANLLMLAISHEAMTVSSIASTVQLARDFSEMRDLETGAHLERMSHYVRIIARALSEELGLSDEFVEKLFLYAPLHDIGKIGIPDHVLLKPAALDGDEWDVMKTHTTKGAEMIDQMRDAFGPGMDASLKMMRNIVELHHEALDGSGYPYGLVGDEIPIEARITTVADIFDALASHRPYKSPWSIDSAFSYLWQMVEDDKIDGRCVKALCDHIDEILEVIDRFDDSHDVSDTPS